jgi:hypothetical protein
MCKRVGQFLIALSVALTAWGVAIPTAPDRAQAGQTKDAKDKTASKDKEAKPKVDPEKLKPDPATVKAQIQSLSEYHKEVFEVEKVPLIEKPHFLVVGAIPSASSGGIGDELEVAYAKACKSLKIDKDPGPWPGKLSILLVPDARKYAQMIRVSQRRRADEEETSSHSIDSTVPQVVVCPSKGPGELNVGATCCVQMGALLIDYKAKGRTPGWLSEGFGRATALQVIGSTALAVERRKAAIYITTNKRTANDVFTSNLKAEELLTLRGSLVEYLAYSGRTEKFLPLIDGFADDGKGNPGNLTSALKNANTTTDELTKNWTNYAKAFK